MSSFSEFDPLDAKLTKSSEAAFGALKREIQNILNSYVGWFDPFCELIQNSLDALDSRSSEEMDKYGQVRYKPIVSVLVDIERNMICVSDNGAGLSKEQFTQFLAPNFSFKTDECRGHKGVGATYLAYGFNHMRVETRTENFSAAGVIKDARRWLVSKAATGNPKVVPDHGKGSDDNYIGFDRGVSVEVFFDETTHPKKLSWIKAHSASAWKKILLLKTGLGAVSGGESVSVQLKVIDSSGNVTQEEFTGIKYYWLSSESAKVARLGDVLNERDRLFKLKGETFKYPDKFSNLEFIYESWGKDEIVNLIGKKLDSEDVDLIVKHDLFVSVEFGYTAKIWSAFNDRLGVRSGYRVASGGIQLAANNMPQGEVIQIPLDRNIGRQNQIHFLVHFSNYTPDMGRKGFHRELTDLAKELGKQITNEVLIPVRKRLRPSGGISPDILREQKVSQWKKEMERHENESPLSITNPHFFLPTEKLLITSTPTREQDVIALFHQLIAGGVVRGIKILSTNERMTYDGLFRVAFDLSVSKYIYNDESNPLGLLDESAKALHGQILDPKVLEYKLSLDGLVEDLENGDKNAKDLDLVVVWETGQDYLKMFGITSLLAPGNYIQREYHGVTHVVTDLDSGGRQFDLIVLSELIRFLNAPEAEVREQSAKYE